MTPVFSFLLIGIALLIYALPSLIAKYRCHRHRTAISVLNFFTGWTFIGWGVSFVWALRPGR